MRLDECKHCTYRCRPVDCENANCSVHDSWYVQNIKLDLVNLQITRHPNIKLIASLQECKDQLAGWILTYCGEESVKTSPELQRATEILNECKDMK